MSEALKVLDTDGELRRKEPLKPTAILTSELPKRFIQALERCEAPEEARLFDHEDEP